MNASSYTHVHTHRLLAQTCSAPRRHRHMVGALRARRGAQPGLARPRSSRVMSGRTERHVHTPRQLWATQQGLRGHMCIYEYMCTKHPYVDFAQHTLISHLLRVGHVHTQHPSPRQSCPCSHSLRPQMLPRHVLRYAHRSAPCTRGHVLTGHSGEPIINTWALLHEDCLVFGHLSARSREQAHVTGTHVPSTTVHHACPRGRGHGSGASVSSQSPCSNTNPSRQSSASWRAAPCTQPGQPQGTQAL